MRGFNDDELVDLIEFGKEVGAEVRFIEYMDVGGATLWSMERVFSKADILARLEGQYGAIEEVPGRGAAPAERFHLPDGTCFGIIASTTEPFCATWRPAAASPPTACGYPLPVPPTRGTTCASGCGTGSRTGTWSRRSAGSGRAAGTAAPRSG